ncbi:MAG: monofunctional biosynthetic peptidoglycan transglycosylase [Spongiibacteraceae bacterium]
MKRKKSRWQKSGWKVLRRLLLWPLYCILGYWLLALVVYRFVNPPLTPLMVLRSIDQREWVQHQSVGLAAISPPLVRAVIAAEDSRFCQHHGIDFDAVGDALADYESSGRLRGASTITMQVARNVFMWNGGGAVRKIVEAPLALLLDAVWPKRRIVEVYLNIAELGDGVFGAQAAARIHFHKPASALTIKEAARLAAVLPNPIRWNAARPTSYINQRTGIIQNRIGQLGPLQTTCLQLNK